MKLGVFPNPLFYISHLHKFLKLLNFILKMARIEDIVQENFSLMYKAKIMSMKRHKFDYEILLNINIVSSDNDYSQSEEIGINCITNEFIINSQKAIYGSQAERIPYSVDDENLKKKPARIKLKLEEDSKNYILSCQDNGCGIPEENKEKIWKMNFSTNGTSGIGLNCVLDWAEKFDCEVYFDSKIGEGTIFYLKIPKK